LRGEERDRATHLKKWFFQPPSAFFSTKKHNLQSVHLESA